MKNYYFPAPKRLYNNKQQVGDYTLRKRQLFIKEFK